MAGGTAAEMRLARQSGSGGDRDALKATQRRELQSVMMVVVRL